MAGVNIAELIQRQKTNPDPLVAVYLAKVRIARLLEEANGLLTDAYEELGALPDLPPTLTAAPTAPDAE
jgi:hypothetical protein